ncbi:MAG: excinuclease ABC subunit UvrC [Clostridia bacterium]
MERSLLLEKINKLPLLAGVYIMKNADGDIIYVGKAKKLRNRVRQYFDSREKQIKVKLMAENVDDFDYILAKNEADAFALECNLIKEHSPKYNILLKDDKAYPYIKIKINEKYPRVMIARRIISDGSYYFGPYVTGMRVNEILDILHLAFPLRTCNIDFSKRNKVQRPCLHGVIHNCLAPCCNKDCEKKYLDTIHDVIDFLNGDTFKARKTLEYKMQQSAENEDFEMAIDYRNKITALDNSNEKIIANLTTLASFDVFSYASDENATVVTVMFVRCGKTVGVSNFLLDSVSDDPIPHFIVQFYKQKEELPPEIIANCELASVEKYFLKEFNKKIKCTTPQKGIKKELVLSCSKNAEEYLIQSGERLARKNRLTTDALCELGELLSLQSKIYRIEGYDISNISGTNMVSSMVVFEGGESNKKEYRKFKIKTVDGQDDFACMEETLARRLKKLILKESGFDKKPDLILIDGGLGQLHRAYKVACSMGIDIPFISLAERNEEIYTTQSNKPIILDKSNYALRLLIRVRDEAHRFALTYHQSLRFKDYKSELENIDGIGVSRRIALKERFKTIEELIEATIPEIASVSGIGDKLAENIFEYLHKK